MRCYRVEDYAAAVAFLRRRVFENNCLLDALEHNCPPFPREVFVAEDQGGLCGLMSVEHFSEDYRVADLRAGGARPEAMALLTRCLLPGVRYRFSLRGEYWPAVEAQLLPGPAVRVLVALTLAPRDLQTVPGPARICALGAPELPLAAAYNPVAEPARPSLRQLLEEALAEPEEQIVYGALQDGTVVAYAHFTHVVDDIWEEGLIHVGPEAGERAPDAQLLCEASRDLLARGRRLLHQVSEADTVARARAAAVGYHEAFRVLTVDTQLRPC